MLQRKRIELEFVTPAFTAGANQDVAEWREPSIRGQMRWWFRAVAGGAFAGDLKRTRDAETRVFGSTDRASTVRIRASTLPPSAFISSGEECRYGAPLNESQIAERWGSPTADTAKRLRVRGPSNPIHYLGYGPIVWNREQRRVLFERGRIESGSEVSFSLLFDDSDLPASDTELLQKALWAWLSLGGIGARSRRGFGSLMTRSADGLIPIAPDLATFREQVGELLTMSRGTSNVPEWSHFSSRAAVYVSRSQSYGTWGAAMEDAGAWLIGFRRRYGVPTDERPSKQNRDYAWFAPGGTESHGNTAHGTRGHVPDRAGFGLPLPFGKHDVLSWKNDREEEGRRASPLLLHIAKFGGLYYSVWTHIPARLIPAGGLLHCDDERTTWSTTAPQEAVIDEFLADLSANTKRLIEKV